MIIDKRTSLLVSLLFLAFLIATAHGLEYFAAKWTIACGEASRIGPGIAYRHDKPPSLYQGLVSARANNHDEINDFVIGCSCAMPTGQTDLCLSVALNDVIAFNGIRSPDFEWMAQSRRIA